MIIPGQSLTAEPKNAPYENPPELNTAEDSIMWHLNRLQDKEKFKALADTLELGLDVVTITEGLLRGAVMGGIHSIDISLIIAPVIHEYITSTAEKLDIDFEEGLPDNSEQDEQIEYQINEKKAQDILAELDMEVEEDMDSEEPMQEELPMDMPKEKPKGLMARRGEEL
jgi:GAF domain-containing protein